MLDHFLRLGGNEVVNSARSYGYVTTADCAVEWLKDPRCATIADAEMDVPYTYTDITDAPWYDPDEPDLSRRFLGLYGVEFLGLSDSTREAEVVQKNGDGAVVTGYRHAAREVRVRAWMTAEGEDALEAGMTWLRNVLEPNACGQHGGACGEADSEFFVDCPPPRRTVNVFSEWMTESVNRAMNPIADATWTANYGVDGDGTSTLVTGVDGEPARRVEWTVSPSTGTAGIVVTSTLDLDIPVEPGEQVQVGIDLASSGLQVWLGYTFTDENGFAIDGGVTEPVTPPNTVTNPLRAIFQTPPAPVDAVKMALTVRLDPAAIDAGSWVTASRLMVGDTPEAYFDGNFTDGLLTQYSWAGPVNGSPSIKATRTVTQEPEDDASYQEYISSHRRFLHSVRCISGPFTVLESISRDKVHIGRLVEFTLLAGVPWVYGVPREVDLQPTLPTVVQDIAYNMAPYPSAEIAGPAIVASTNYSTNPSLETDATGWVKTQTAPIVTGEVVAARVTGELAAVGTASYRAVFTASGASAVAGTFSNEQEVALPADDLNRYSISMWSATVIMAGTPVRDDILFRAYWRSSAGGTVLRTDVLGTVPADGGAISVKSIEPPVGATHVLVRATAQLTSWNAGTIVRLYSDALAVTNP